MVGLPPLAAAGGGRFGGRHGISAYFLYLATYYFLCFVSVCVLCFDLF